MKTRSPGLLAVALFTVFLPSTTLAAGQSWRYQLLEGSHLVDDCPICGRPSIFVPLHGAFDLRLLETNPLYSRYAIENISFASSSGEYVVSGSGILQIGGEVAITQEWMLETLVIVGAKTNAAVFTNSTRSVTRKWPMLHSVCEQTNATLLQVFQIEIAAAPIRDIWFSTVNGFTAGKPFNSTNPISGGDLLSSSGNRIKRNRDLTSNPGVAEPDLGLDAVDVLPGGQIVYSTDQTGAYPHSSLRYAGTLGNISIQELLAPIIGGPSAIDPGLDALQVNTASFATEYYFSLKTNLVVFQDPKPNINLRHGDILVSDLFMEGRTFKRYVDLLTRFRPVLWEGEDFGLDAFYIWPSGEIWFSTEFGFQSELYGTIMPGDLLSDDGYVVFKNLDLLSTFAPLEDLSDFGLDALFIVTDVAAPSAQPQLRIAIDRQKGDVSLEWSGIGRVFEVQRAPDVTGPWQPVTALTTDTSFTDPGAVKALPGAFYRVRQW